MLLPPSLPLSRSVFTALVALKHNMLLLSRLRSRAHPDLSQGPADLQSAALATELCTQLILSSKAKCARLLHK